MSAPIAPAARAARRLGLLGGSFDPPHCCHLEIARHAAEAFELDHVVFVPAARPPHKPGRTLASGADRLALVQLLVADEPDFASTWAGELAREGPSYSVDTVAEFASLTEAELFWILGSDNLPGLAGWHRVEELLAAARPIVHFRRGEALERAQLARLSSTAAERVVAGYLELPPCDANSTAIRAALASNEDPGEALPARLAEYVRARGLYRA